MHWLAAQHPCWVVSLLARAPSAHDTATLHWRTLADQDISKPLNGRENLRGRGNEGDLPFCRLRKPARRWNFTEVTKSGVKFVVASP